MMSETNMIYVAILLGAVLVSAVSQVLLKKEAMKPHTSVAREYLNVRVIAAYFLFFCSTLLSVYSYRGVPLSLGTVLESTSYIYITFFGVLVFKERINRKKLAALACIIAGIAVFAFAG
jgi:drug/metabolite transporter (DMT)-like permease